MKARIVRLGRLGKRLEGPAIGKLLARFLNNCRNEGCIAVIDCFGVESIGDAVIRNAVRFVREMPETYVADACEKVAESLNGLLTGFYRHTSVRRQS